MTDRADRYYLTTAEMLVMRTIWKSDHDLVLHEVVEICNENYGKDWKPQTVSTYLSHLVQKKFVKMIRNGKLFTYHPLVPSEEFLVYELNNLADYWGFLSPSEMLQAYIDHCGITEEDRAAIKAIAQSL